MNDDDDGMVAVAGSLPYELGFSSGAYAEDSAILLNNRHYAHHAIMSDSASMLECMPWFSSSIMHIAFASSPCFVPFILVLSISCPQPVVTAHPQELDFCTN